MAVLLAGALGYVTEACKAARRAAYLSADDETSESLRRLAAETKRWYLRLLAAEPDPGCRPFSEQLDALIEPLIWGKRFSSSRTSRFDDKSVLITMGHNFLGLATVASRLFVASRGCLVETGADGTFGVEDGSLRLDPEVAGQVLRVMAAPRRFNGICGMIETSDGDRAEQQADDVLRACMLFVFGHEVAHVFTENDGPVLLPLPDRDQPDVHARDEIWADLHAFFLTTMNVSTRYERYALLAGARIAIGLVGLLDDLMTALPARGYPSVALRWREIRHAATRDLPASGPSERWGPGLEDVALLDRMFAAAAVSRLHRSVDEAEAWIRDIHRQAEPFVRELGGDEVTGFSLLWDSVFAGGHDAAYEAVGRSLLGVTLPNGRQLPDGSPSADALRIIGESWAQPLREIVNADPVVGSDFEQRVVVKGVYSIVDLVDHVRGALKRSDALAAKTFVSSDMLLAAAVALIFSDVRASQTSRKG